MTLLVIFRSTLRNMKTLQRHTEISMSLRWDESHNWRYDVESFLWVTAGKDTKKETKLGLSAKKAVDFGEWYSQVVVESEMISYYDVSGARKLPCRRRCFPQRG